MRRLRIYLDTSVINFLFATDAPDFRAVTVDFFEHHDERYDLFNSELVLLEIDKDPNEEHKRQLLTAIEQYGPAILPGDNREEVLELAGLYIDRGAIPRSKEEDAQHVAYATVYEMDILASWNFKHLANVNREAKILQANLEAGYRYPLRLLSPLELTYER